LSLDEALGLGAPSAEEEQKRSLLRALKDLEYERSVGKISEQDYQEFSARYRAEAKRIILQLDDRLAKAQELAETLAEERVRNAGLALDVSLDAKPVTLASDASDASRETEPAEAPDGSQGAASPCAACSTENESDARFCKHCGGALSKPVTPSEAPARESSEEKIP
jgi:hypothetical protein